MKELRKYLGLAGNPGEEKRARSQARRTKRQTYPYPPNFSTMTYPASFDAAVKWPQCASVINAIQDQGQCGSCWAVSSSSVITDRRCVQFNVTTRISAWDLTSCCQSCWGGSTGGCDGGYLYEAFKFFYTTGVVSGGGYPSIGTSGAYCKPYPLSPYDTAPSSTPCSQTCQSGYTARTYSADKRLGSNYFMIDFADKTVMYDLMTRGPMVVMLDVYEDFYDYYSGIYQHSYGQFLGYHAVRLTGWGTDSTGTKYWKVANSWGNSWGENGFFRILRGTNECNLEYYDGVAGIVKN